MRGAWILVVALCIAAVTPGWGTCGPLLNEIMGGPARDWDGDSSYNYKNDEWVEIVNPGPGGLSLSGYILTDERGKPVYAFAGTLAQGAVAVVYGSTAVQWESGHGQSTTGLRLGNDGDTVMLKQVVGSDTLAVDAYTYNTYEAGTDRSTGRRPDGAAHWEIYDGLNPYSGSTQPSGNGLDPTPGASNGGSPTPPPSPVAQETWGKVKDLFVR